MVTTNGIFIVDSLGKFLVVHPNNHEVNLWSIPKGLTDEGETSLQAGVRETLEETNINLIDLMSKGCYYYDLGEYIYKSNVKKVHAHLMILTNPLSTFDLDLKCDSYYTCRNDGNEYPEIDIIKWETLEFLQNNLHYTQQTFLEKVEELVVYHLKK